ncbi:MAG: YidC/Oxa1 family membrane protein insertase [Patescibacteria group bacterium]|jgi:YidC/Oxa1 family membrane protein insertase
MNFFDVLLINPITNILFLFYKGFEILHIPGTLGFAIIAATVAIRLAVNPLMKHQIEQSAKMQELQPLISKLQKKYKDEPAKLQAAQMELYKEKKINPGLGCLMLIIQMPLFIGLYTALSQAVVNGTAQKVIDGLNARFYFSFLHITRMDVSFFGFQLDQHPSAWQKLGWWYLIIPVVTGGLQLLQSYLTLKSTTSAKKEEPKSVDGKEEKKEPDMAVTMQKQMMIIFPLMIGWMSFNFPVGLALYWNIFTLFGVWQYWQQLKKKPAQEVVSRKAKVEIKSKAASLK